MTGMQRRSARDLFETLDRTREGGAAKQGGLRLTFSFFEIYGGRVIDLLNGRSKLMIQEDGRGQVNRSFCCP
jgi:kinesin family protein 2/24